MEPALIYAKNPGGSQPRSSSGRRFREHGTADTQRPNSIDGSSGLRPAGRGIRRAQEAVFERPGERVGDFIVVFGGGCGALQSGARDRLLLGLFDLEVGNSDQPCLCCLGNQDAIHPDQ